MPFKSTYNQQEFQARKVPSSGFLNSFLKTPNVIHSRTASYQSYYGSLGKSAHCSLLFVAVWRASANWPIYVAVPFHVVLCSDQKNSKGYVLWLLCLLR